MYERFTDRSRKVMQLANQEAQRFNHEYIGTEHVLLGLIKEGSGVAANVLKNMDIDLRKVRLEVEKLVQSGPDMVTMGKLPQTPRTMKVIQYAMDAARQLQHNYVGTEHLLIGLLREQEGVAAHVRMNLGLKLEDVQEEILELLGHAHDRKADAQMQETHNVVIAVETDRYELLREKITMLLLSDYSTGTKAATTIDGIINLLSKFNTNAEVTSRPEPQVSQTFRRQEL